MPKTIQQTVRFDVPPARVFDLYANSRLHAAATGAPAKVARKPGGSVSAHGGYIRGKLLQLRRPRMLVQTWRGADWSSADADSVLVLTFARPKSGKGTVLQMVHANVPDAHAGHLSKGWHTQYWDKWRAYLATPAKAKATKAKRRSTAKRKTGATRSARSKRPARKSAGRRR